MHAGLKEESPLKKVTSQMFLGEDNFIEKLRGFIRGKETLKEIPRVQRYVTRPSLEEMFKEKKVKGKPVYRAHVTYGYTLKEIAEHLGVHYTTISRAVKRVEDEREK